ncbi:troponin T-like [Ambystoma mexicanum]|uniref:troponin T-like n=1 Tax=Ambystoma mexicanum TaxID=8296 RepID=UPI0037E8BCEA
MTKKQKEVIHIENSPRMTEEFLMTSSLMDISVYSEVATDKKNVHEKHHEQIPQEEHFTRDQIETVIFTEHKMYTKKGQTPGEKQGENQMEQSRLEYTKEQREWNPKNENRRPLTPKKQKLQRTWEERTRRTPRRERLTRREKELEEVRVFKLEQSSCKSEYIILNRKTVLKTLNKINSLKHQNTDNFLLIEPYHRDQKAKTYLHIKSKALKSLTHEPHKELKKIGFTLTDITQQEKQLSRRGRNKENEEGISQQMTNPQSPGKQKRYEGRLEKKEENFRNRKYSNQGGRREPSGRRELYPVGQRQKAPAWKNERLYNDSHVSESKEQYQRPAKEGIKENRRYEETKERGEGEPEREDPRKPKGLWKWLKAALNSKLDK